MGQYYKPVCIETMEWLYSHDYGNGLKLMEHSYIGNDFVGAVMKLLMKGNKWHKKQFVWCGDYADAESEGNYYDNCKDENKLFVKKPVINAEQLKYKVVNHTKKEYVDLNDYCVDVGVSLGDDLVIHPLPLLTALGNGGGGGDYEGTNMDKVGIWAKDSISVETEAPDGFEELKIKFKEGR